MTRSRGVTGVRVGGAWAGSLRSFAVTTSGPDLPTLFQPITLRELTVRNRVWTSPMCQYAVEARDGVPNDWHVVHYGSLAVGGFGVVMTEATAVTPEGRISPEDTGLWNDDQVRAWRRITDFAHSRGARMGVQLGHAGRKASTVRWWPGFTPGIVPESEGGWPVVGPTTQAGDGVESAHTVHALTDGEIEGVIDAFVAATHRAAEAGFDTVGVHAAHGYLLHQFYSPLSNTRTDRWGGDSEGRTRLVREVARAVRGAWPQDLPVIVRLSAVDWRGDGWQLDDSVRLAAQLKDLGVDLVDVSSGGVAQASIAVGPGYQVPFAERIRREAGIATAAVGMITSPKQAEEILERGRADVVLLAREALRDTNWPLRAAHQLGVPASEAPWQPARWRGAWH